MNEELKKPYNPTEHEPEVYKKWEESGFFAPEVRPSWADNQDTNPNFDNHFSMVLPPPNVTGNLHIGHALTIAIEDIMTRYNRMLGKRTLWIPGTDHAAIATQSKVEKIIQKEEGKNRYDLGRGEFLKRVNQFARDNHDTIINQAKKMGASLDWSREAFTLDEKRNLAVKTVFKKMYDDGLIYRGFRVVNWDPKGQTTISDDEIVYEERKAKFYTFKYSKDFPISISTTRPETKVGDTAVAVHPEDPRYQKYVGQTFEIADFAGEKLSIKIIADKEVDPEFGTGALGVTPAHSQIDEGLAQKHYLEMKPVINEYARMSVESPLLKDKKTTEAREIVVEWLKENGLLEKEEEISQNVSTAERTGGIIEPLPKMQWFIDVNKEFLNENKKVTLKKLMLSAVEDKQIKIMPERFEKEYTHWIANLRDWCISRQIWYGHRVPVWYRLTDPLGKPSDEVYCDIESPEDEGWIQDEDTLDTWFSSGLWTFSTLGWPENTNDFKNYHPTTVLETGYDILFFWVARMILMSTYTIGQIPFKNVYLHGLVRDKEGRKISKSLGNNIDPVDIAAKYGADAMRMALIVGSGPGNDTKVSEEKFKAYKHFANKLWNITRFVLENNSEMASDEIEAIKYDSNKKYLDEFNALAKDVTSDMENYRFYLAAEKLYHYSWHTFADIIIEESKEKIKNGGEEAEATKNLLGYLLKEQLKLLHPFMPFITEKIWSMLPNTKDMLIVEKWPHSA